MPKASSADQSIRDFFAGLNEYDYENERVTERERERDPEERSSDFVELMRIADPRNSEIAWAVLGERPILCDASTQTDDPVEREGSEREQNEPIPGPSGLQPQQRGVPMGLGSWRDHDPRDWDSDSSTDEEIYLEESIPPTPESTSSDSGNEEPAPGIIDLTQGLKDFKDWLNDHIA